MCTDGSRLSYELDDEAAYPYEVLFLLFFVPLSFLLLFNANDSPYALFLLTLLISPIYTCIIVIFLFFFFFSFA